MPAHSLLADLILTYAIALLFVVTLARVRVPAIVALMLAGVVAGPGGAGIVKTVEEVEMLAEIGVILLLFTVGLDFSLTTMRELWRPILIAGSLQMAGTAAVIAAVLVLLTNLSTQLAIFIGLFIALSSTAIVLKALAERNDLASPHGRMTVGILLLQDLAIVGLLLLVPILSGRTPLSAVPAAVGRALLAIVAVAAASRLLLPALLRFVTASGRREAFSLAILVASVGTAWIGSLIGLSMAAGAFLAGLMLAESEFSHQAYAEVRPVRDMLSGLFFISLGMLIDLPVLARQLPVVLALAAGVIVLKAIVASGALLAAGSSVRVAVTSGVGLAQVGEFSFILGRAGLAAGLMPVALWQPLLGASIATMVLTPSLLAVAPAIAARLRPSRGLSTLQAEGIPRLAGHIVILGFGLGGQIVARAMRELGVPYLILELNGATVRQAKADGELVFYGDATSPESLEAAGIKEASALVSLLSDPDAAARMVKTVRLLAPSVPIIVRTRYRLEADRMRELGATVAVAEELEASLEVLAQLLGRLQIPGNVIETLLDVFRRESLVLRPLRAPRARLDSLPEELQRMPVATHRVDADHWAAGRSIGELNLRADTNASVLAIGRDGAVRTAIAPDDRIAEGDVLYLTGDESDVLLARQRLTSGGSA
ncbi:MAG: cation:proton antiporter [Acidobacteria bacterium]|nr:cation:proton antiporter [Acidobacteriota bacterium]